MPQAVGAPREGLRAECAWPPGGTRGFSAAEQEVIQGEVAMVPGQVELGGLWLPP